MKHTIIAPVGDNMSALFIGLKEFPTEKIILLTPDYNMEVAEKTAKDLKRFEIPCKIIEIKGEIWEEVFRLIAEISRSEPESKILINTATGDRITTCAATSAAFVNGIKAFSVEKGMTMLLPVLKFSYYRLITDKKMELLKTLSRPDCCISLLELSKRTRMSLPLISYHINGNLKSEGMKEMGLVETADKKGAIEVKISMLGKLLMKGYLS